MENILEFINNKIITSIYDFYLLFLLFSTLLFLSLSFFLIKDFNKKLLYMFLVLIIFFLNILISSNIPGTAKNFEYVMGKISKYKYVHHFISTDKKNTYYVLKEPDSDIYYFFVTKYDKDELERLKSQLMIAGSSSRNDQNKDKEVVVILKREGIKSFETKFEIYDIDVPVLPPKE